MNAHVMPSWNSAALQEGADLDNFVPKEAWSMTISLEKARQLLDYCELRQIDEFYARNKNGACIGAGLAYRGLAFYLDGCNPEIDEDWRHNCIYQFGSADFVEFVPVDVLRGFFQSPLSNKIRDFTLVGGTDSDKVLL